MKMNFRQPVSYSFHVDLVVGYHNRLCTGIFCMTVQQWPGRVLGDPTQRVSSMQ